MTIISYMSYPRLHTLLSQRWVRYLALGTLLILAVFSVRQIVQRTYYDEMGAYDLHPYWYYGHFAWESENPYKAYDQLLTPTLPLTYLDGTIISDGPVAQAGLGGRPPNTAPMLLTISLLSRFSWPIAKTTWLISNLAFLAIIPFAILRLYPKPRTLSWEAIVLVVATTYALSAARTGGTYGQTTFLVFAALLGALLLPKRSWWLAGLLLGLALSKYSIAIGFFVYFVLLRRWRMVLTAIGVQIAGILTVSWLGWTNPVNTVRAYLYLATDHMGLGGIHLAAPFENQAVDRVLAVVITFAVAGMLGWWWLKFRPKLDHDRILNLHLLSVLIFWSLIAVYHLNYDMIIVMIFIALLVYGLYHDVWRFSAEKRTFLWLIVTLLIFLLTFPDRPVQMIFPDIFVTLWGLVRGPIILLTMYLMAYWLLWRYSTI